MGKGLAFQVQVYISVNTLADIFAKWNATFLTWLRIFRCELKIEKTNVNRGLVLQSNLKKPCKMDKGM